LTQAFATKKYITIGQSVFLTTLYKKYSADVDQDKIVSWFVSCNVGAIMAICGIKKENIRT